MTINPPCLDSGRARRHALLLRGDLIVASPREGNAFCRSKPSRQRGRLLRKPDGKPFCRRSSPVSRGGCSLCDHGPHIWHFSAAYGFAFIPSNTDGFVRLLVGARKSLAGVRNSGSRSPMACAIRISALPVDRCGVGQGRGTDRSCRPTCVIHILCRDALADARILPSCSTWPDRFSKHRNPFHDGTALSVL